MTDTLAEKLRQITADDNDEADILFEAADRIEELEKALRDIDTVCKQADDMGIGWFMGVHKIARAALEKKDD